MNGGEEAAKTRREGREENGKTDKREQSGRRRGRKKQDRGADERRLWGLRAHSFILQRKKNKTCVSQ